MKKIYSVFSLLMILAVSLSAQTRIYAPTLKLPVNGDVKQMPDVFLDWLAVTGITLDITYEAQLATTNDFSDPVTYPRTDVTSVQTSDLIFGNQYFWRVRAFDAENASDWSEVFSFQVVWTVSLFKPNDGAIVESDPEIAWTPVTGIAKYQFQIDTTYAWKLANSGVTSSLNSTYVVNEANIWAVGADGLVLHFDGTSWSTIESGVTDNLNDVCFVDDTHGYAVGDAGTILFYDGTTWTTQTTSIAANLMGISFADVDKGVAVGAGGKVALYNTGTWTEVTSGVIDDITDVDMLAENNIWACGKSSKVVHYDGTTWSSEDVGTRDYNGISFQDENNGWIVGKNGVIFHYDGAAWFEETSNTTKELKSVSVYNYKGFAVGASGTLLALDGGWALVSSGTTKELLGVSVLGSYGAVVGTSGTLLQKMDDGFNSPVLKTILLSADITTYKLANLFFNKTYYYRIRAIHTSDTSGWSQVRSMNTRANVALSSPDNNAITELIILFKWVKYSGAAEYIIELDDNLGFSTPTEFFSESNSISLISSVFGTEFYWHVAVRNANDVSEWSDTWSFTTKDAVELTAPANGMQEVSACPKFIWTAIVGSPEYEVWVSKTADFADPISGIVTEPVMQCVAQMERNTTFYWKVRGVTLIDTSGWSPVWSFRTEGYIGIEEHLNGDAVSIYPNPNHGEFTLSVESYTSDDYLVKVSDIAGRVVYSTNTAFVPGGNQIKISIPEIQKGMYTVSISQGDQSITQKLLIK
ncbi:MAG: T9SS type A sorting domain-containing protein [Bacteroidales bacterium]|nr:T9SS type A sorting domain-containing protein [Bacteroidales bacterium]